MRTKLSEANIGSEIYYPVPLHMQECFANLGCSEGALPNSELAAQETIALPIYSDLSEAQLAHVADTLISIVRAL